MKHKTELKISLLLPQLPNAKDNCVQRLSDLMASKAGIQKVHQDIEHVGGGELCIHFDPDQLTVAQIRDIAQQAGTEIAARYGHLVFRSVATHAREARELSRQLEAIGGVLEGVAAADGTVRIEFDRQVINETELLKSLRGLGVETGEIEQPHMHDHDSDEKHDHDGDCHHHGGVLGPNTELIFSALSGICLLAGWLISYQVEITSWVPLSFYVLAYLFGGSFMVREAWEKLTSGRFEIDFLMLIAAAGAAVLNEWAEGALLLFLFSVGHALEHYAMGRAKRAIEALAELAPTTAIVKRQGGSVEVPVEELQRGDIVLVKPNERITADGFVVKGESSVNQAPITGESVPVDKHPVTDPQFASEDPESLGAEFRVFAGTINESGALEIQVTKLAGENTLSRVVNMVSEAETRISPTQQFTNKFERIFVPSILVFIVSLLFAWVIVDEPLSASFYRAMAVLVAASPCALAIATPSAVLSGIARAARGGVLIKGGGPLEGLGQLNAIAFDKTGTLTVGKPKLTDVHPAPNVDESELLRIAIAVEALSDHPLAAAVVRDGRERLAGISIPEATDLKSITGRGVKANVEGLAVYIGKDDLFSEVLGPTLPNAIRSMVEQLEQEGRTTMIVRHGERYLGVLGLMDTPREAAKNVIARLHQLGVKRMIMLSGDNQKVADAVAKAVGLDEARGDLMPEDKVHEIRQLRENGGVAMVGDGVNDAPAMANATVGIAMGVAGSDVALETADVALMGDALELLPFAVGLSRQTSRIIKQNLWFSLGMIVFLIPATVFGLQMGAAVLLHEGSTLLVVFNALRLLAYQDR